MGGAKIKKSGVGFHLNGFPHDRMEDIAFAVGPT